MYNMYKAIKKTNKQKTSLQETKRDTK